MVAASPGTLYQWLSLCGAQGRTDRLKPPRGISSSPSQRHDREAEQARADRIALEADLSALTAQAEDQRRAATQQRQRAEEQNELAVRERDRAEAAERAAMKERDRALSAEQTATGERNRARLAEEAAISQKQRANTESVTANAVSVSANLLAQAGGGCTSSTGYKEDPDLKVRTVLDRAAGVKMLRRPLVEAIQQIGNVWLGVYADARAIWNAR
jgi:hypothetical protein